MEPKKIKQDIILEEVFTTAETPEEVDKLQEKCKRVGINKVEVLPSMGGIHHHGTIILHDFKDPFLQKKSANMTVLNSSNSYNLLLARECNIFYKVCQNPLHSYFGKSFSLKQANELWKDGVCIWWDDGGAPTDWH